MGTCQDHDIPDADDEGEKKEKNVQEEDPPMDSTLVHHPLVAPPLLDDPLPQIHDHHQHRSLRIPPIRDALPSRNITVPSPLEPHTTGGAAGASQDPNASSSKAGMGGNPPSELPTLEDFLHAARTKSFMDSSASDPLLNPREPSAPPKTILPSFINLRAVEKLPYASFNDDADPSRSSKRRRMDINGDVFGDPHLQLPVPQNQKEKKRPPFGPLTILNGLNEPPPNAAMFPPIEPNAVHQILTRPTRNTPPPGEVDEGGKLSPEVGLNATATGGRKQGESSERKTGDSDGEPAPPAATGTRPRKKLRKWTDEETNDLLRGVVKCGIGNWTTILSQPELNFNNRSAANLKDRFRVCCPWAYGTSDANEATEAVQTTLANALNDGDPNSTNPPSVAATASTASNPSTPTRPNAALSEAGSASLSPQSSSAALADLSLEPGPGPSSTSSSTSTSTKPKSRNKYPPTFKSAPTLSHKSKSTLVSLGVAEPYFTIKSTRRSRRPFTPVEDEALIKGYSVHGFQWTQIQQDKELNLGHRKATDLRDRFRTKFPEIYKEGGVPQLQQPQVQVQQRRTSPETGTGGSRRTNSAGSATTTPPTATTAARANSDSGIRSNAHHPASATTLPLPERRKSTAMETTLPIIRSIPHASQGQGSSSLFQFADESAAVGGVSTGASGSGNAEWDGSLQALVWDEM
ncbi:hypothetical protein FQN54_004847 [Arachnomyces sp. PD_36]|nr:hypothetical protein FQN54_004847 [Arachnomyces sp. PD_36]